MRFSLLFIFTVSYLSCANPLATLTVFELANNILDIVQNVVDISKRIDSSRSAQENTVLQELGDIILFTKELSGQLERTDNDLDKIRHLFQKQGTTELNLIHIRRNQIFLDNYFNKMEEYVMDNEEYTNTTLIKFANTVVSPLDNSVPKLIDFMHQKLTEGKFLEEFSQLFVPRLGTDAYFCKLKQSPSQILQNFLIEVLILKTKSFVLIQGAYMFKKLYQKNFGDKMNDSLLDDFAESTNELVRAFKPGNASSELWRCDPTNHKEGTTYVQIKNFLHGFILNKVNLDSEGSCRSECNSYTYVTKMDCRDNEWCKKETECPTIVNCAYVDKSMTVYSQDIETTNRRYEHVEFGTGLKYGKKNQTSKKKFLETYSYMFFQKCSYCFCLCDEGSKIFSESYINMNLTVSNITGNKVVTGLRFIKKNGIIHLQIQEGKVMEKGKIDVDSIRWVPTLNYSRTDDDVKKGREYHALSWKHRGFELKDIMADDGYVVTGVRFLKIGDGLHLQPLVTRYDFRNGKLGLSHFQEDKNVYIKQKYEKKLKLNSPDIPTLSYSSDVISANMKVEFTHSDFEKDAGQTTVPFFDAQPVESAVPVPLSGIGIIHRGRSGYGGFIAPRIFTYNFTQHLTSTRPANSEL